MPPGPSHVVAQSMGGVVATTIALDPAITASRRLASARAQAGEQKVPAFHAFILILLPIRAPQEYSGPKRGLSCF